MLGLLDPKSSHGHILDLGWHLVLAYLGHRVLPPVARLFPSTSVYRSMRPQRPGPREKFQTIESVPFTPRFWELREPLAMTTDSAVSPAASLDALSDFEPFRKRVVLVVRGSALHSPANARLLSKQGQPPKFLGIYQKRKTGGGGCSDKFV